MLARLWPAIAIASLSLAFASIASADRLPPEGPCDFSELGEACEENGAKGTCVKKTCSRLSYAGGERTSVEYECKRCDTASPKPKPKPITAEPAAPTPEPKPKPITAEPAAPTPKAPALATPEPTAPPEPASKAATENAPPEELATEEPKAAAAESSSKGLCTVDPEPSGAPLLLLGLLFLRRRS